LSRKESENDEQLTLNQRVVGSIPTSPTIPFSLFPKALRPIRTVRSP
jgi:hypothetical protein